uniref:Cytochrome P450 71A1 n=1 Tax=Aegilops tauschii subsp. strangulata TaxID=200361 RepID=A0A453EHM6_AEGTS
FASHWDRPSHCGIDMDASSLFALLHSPLLILALLVPIVSFVLFFAKKPQPSGSNGGPRLPPSPWGLPILGHLPLLGSLPHRKLRSLAEAHGPVMLLRLGGVPTVVASSADAALEVMKTHDLAFASRPAVRMAERLLYGRDMAFAPYGQYWRQARRVCVLHLLSARRVASFRRVREQEAGALVDRVRRAAASCSRPEGDVVNLTDELISYTSAVISRAAFGDDGGYGIDDDLTEVFAEFEELLGTAAVGEFVPWLAWVDALMGLDAKVARAGKVMDRLLERVISDHRQRRLGGGRRLVGDGEDDHRDFVDVLLDVSEDDGEDSGGVRFDTVGIKAIILVRNAGTCTFVVCARIQISPLSLAFLGRYSRCRACSQGNKLDEDVHAAASVR